MKKLYTTGIAGLSALMFAGNAQATLVETVVNGEFTGGDVFTIGGGGNWTNHWVTPGVWVFNTGASDRIEDQASGGNPDGYIANGTLATGDNTTYGVFDVSSLALGGELAGGNATLSFDILNDTGADISYNYSVWYADETATGSPGGFGGLPGANMPFGGGSDTRFMNGTGTALAAETGWNTDQVSVIFDLDTINFATDGVGSISSLSDVNRIVIALEFNNTSANLDAGIDNVSFVVSTAVPEPSTLALFAISLLGLALKRSVLRK